MIRKNLVLLAAAALAAPVFAESTPQESGSQSLLQLLEQGGWAMWPLGLCSLLTFYLTFHCLRETGRKRFVGSGLGEAGSFLASGRIADAAALLGRSPGVPPRLALALVGRIQSGHPAGEAVLGELLADRLDQEEASVAQWINYLNVVATVAPMIGLLGTVSGMIGAFQTIASGGMGKPELLAGDIGEALITTATGLIIAIPAMIAFFILRNRLANRLRQVADAVDPLFRSLCRLSPENPVPEPSVASTPAGDLSSAAPLR